MSRKERLNEEEINKFLAHSDDDDDEDSDWDNIGEVDVGDYLKPKAEPPKPKSDGSDERGVKSKKVVTFRKITDVGLDALFSASKPEEGSRERLIAAEDDDDDRISQLNASGLFVEKHLRDAEQLSAEQRVDKEIQRFEREKAKQESKQPLCRDGFKNASPQTNGNWDTSRATSSPLPLSEAQKKDYFIPNGTSIRVVRPRVSSSSWGDKILNRKVCILSDLRPGQVETDLASVDWLTVGVVVYPPDVRRSRGGAGPPYSIWRMSDLDNLDRIVSLFLFGAAHQSLWKEAATGLVVALLRPRLSSSISGASSKEEQAPRQDGQSPDLTLTIDNPQQALVLGLSKDFGTCSSRTKAGAMCKRIVNRALCEYCEFHVRQLYRSSGNSRPGFSQAIGVQAKRLAGRGRSRGAHTALLPPSRPKDFSNGASAQQLRVLSKLGGPGASQLASHINQMCSPVASATAAGRVSSSVASATPSLSRRSSGGVQAQNGAATGRTYSEPLASTSRVGAPSSALQRSASASKSSLSSQITSFQSFFKTHENSRPPSLSDPSKDSSLNVMKVALPRKSEPPMDRARARAIALVRAKGGVKTMQDEDRQRRLSERMSDENFSPSVPPEARPSLKRLSAAAALAPLPVGNRNGNEKNAGVGAKRSKLLAATNCANEEELMREIERGSKHTELVAAEEQNQEERYFRSLEFREKYEEKLSNVREHPVAIVACGVCHYRAEGKRANDLCLREHPQAVRHGKGVRRYFVCEDCHERTTSLEMIPTRNCKKCGGSNFRRTGMLRERRGPKLVDETLMARGEEHCKFLSADV